MLTPEGGGIAERPLTATNTYNIRRSRNIKRCPGCCLQRRVWGSGGKAPGSTGAGLKVLLGVGKAHGFSGLPPALIKRKRHLQASLPLNPLYGNIPVKGRSAIPPPSGVSICSLSPLTIFFEIGGLSKTRDLNLP